MNTSDSLFVGVDVSAKTCAVAMRQMGKSGVVQHFANETVGHRALIKALAGHARVHVCVEATGMYSMDLVMALHGAGISVMVVNPKSSHNFAKALLLRSKTDNIDADTLAQYAERMPFVPWQLPAAEHFALRAFARRLTALTEEKAAAKNQLHALSSTAETPRALLRDAKRGIAQLEKRIDQLTTHALKLIKAHETLRTALTLITSICGIANTSAIALLGEVLVLPSNLTHKQWVAHAGLDPRETQSGTSVHKAPRLSKAGNRYIRRALYMPALCAAQRDPYVKAFYQHLIANGKKPLQALCAVQRKLLHAIHGMLRDQKPFDNTRFFAMVKT